MGREIKFRGWIRDQHRMVGPLSIDEVAKQWSLPLYWCELMQFTGLKDKNGVEIYEGDVCRVINPNGDEDKVCHVDFDSISSCYTYSPEDGYGDYDISSIGWAMQLGFEFEVIGNIYENPDLI